jgi:protein SCO1/2
LIQPLHRAAVALALLGALAGAASAQPLPADPLRQIGYDQRLGETVPRELAFRDEQGKAVRMGDYLGERPVLLVLAYYKCPMLCTMVQTGVTTTLKSLAFVPGKEFDVVVVSINPAETPALAAEAKAAALARYGRTGTEKGWHFLTGPEESIRQLTRTVGFRYIYDKARDEYGHAAGIVLLTPEGRIARYFFGIEYPPRDLRLGLIEAADRRIGTPIDQIFLYCFHYDPVVGKYSAVTLNILRVSAAATVLALGLLVYLLRRREQQRPKMLGTA